MIQKQVQNVLAALDHVLKTMSRAKSTNSGHRDLKK